MASVLLTHPYFLALDPAEAAQGRPYPPLATLVTGAVLREAGHDVSLFDPMFASGPADFAAHVARERPGWVAIVGDDHAVPMKQCLAGIRDATIAMVQAALGVGARVLVSGPDVSDRPAVYLDAGAHAAVVGDAAEAVRDWVGMARDIPGVHGDRGAGGRRALISDLGRLPRAAWDLLDVEPYARTWRERHGAWEVNLWTARGCPFRCNWCAKPTWGRSYNVRPADAVAREVEWIRTQLRPDRIWFTDDIFGLRPAWLREFRAALTTPVPFRCLSRADLLHDPAYVADLAAVGCEEVWLGVESGSGRVLRAMDKDLTVGDVHTAVNRLRSAGLRVGFFLQLGYPGEKLRDVGATARLIRDLRPDEIGVSVSYPLPGTAFHERVSAGADDARWVGSMENRALFQAPYGPGFYVAAKEVLRSTASAARGADAVRAFLRRPDVLSARRVAGAAWHSGRLPIVWAQMLRHARPNPNAVPLSW